MTTQSFLGKDQFVIDRDLKAATAGRNQLPFGDKVFDFTFVQDGVRQTDGAGCVVSGGAIFNGNTQ
jgi:hypothetical protein